MTAKTTDEMKTNILDYCDYRKAYKQLEDMGYSGYTFPGGYKSRDVVTAYCPGQKYAHGICYC